MGGGHVADVGRQRPAASSRGGPVGSAVHGRPDPSGEGPVGRQPRADAHARVGPLRPRRRELLAPARRLHRRLRPVDAHGRRRLVLGRWPRQGHVPPPLHQRPQQVTPLGLVLIFQITILIIRSPFTESQTTLYSFLPLVTIKVVVLIFVLCLLL